MLASAAGVSYSFTVPTGYLFARWRIKGDLKYTTGVGTTAKTNPTKLSSVKALDGSTPGYGKGRVTALYYKLTSVCGGDTAFRTFDLDVYKTIAANVSAIAGPTCITAGTASVVYSVPPILSGQSQIQAGIGADIYDWQVRLVSNPLTQVTFQYAAGDQSSISILSIPAESFTVDVQVGQCNILKGPTPGSGRLTVEPAKTNLETALGNFPQCRALSEGAGTISALSLTAVVGVTYTVRGPGTWTIGSNIGGTIVNGTPNLPLVISGASGLVTINVKVPTADKGSGDIIVKAQATTGICLSTQTSIRTLSRSLTSANIVAGCMASAGANTNVTLSNAPANAVYEWELPYAAAPNNYAALAPAVLKAGTGGATGVAPIYTTTTPVITVDPPTGATSYLVKVWLTGCASNFVSKTVVVTSDLVCNTTYTDIEKGTGAQDAQYTLKTNGVINTCTPTGAGVAYTWELSPSGALGTWYLAPVDQFNSNPTIAPTYQALGADPTVMTGLHIRVTVTNTNTCLNSNFTKVDPLLRPGPLGGGGVKPGLPASARHGQEWLSAYPNPSRDGKLRVDLTMPTGQALVTISDLTGRTLKTVTITQERSMVSVSDLPAGTYALRAQLPSGTVLKHLIQVQ